MRRGVEVERTDSLATTGPGMSWKARFAFRGKPRDANLTLTEMAAPHVMGFTALSEAIEVVSKVELIEMIGRRTRIHVVSEIKPRSLGARLFLQSLRLARAKVDRRFDSKIDQLASDLEKRAKASGRKA